MMLNTDNHQEIIIVRRGGDGHDDGHHGGAWKVAFADLITAIMAFFLVMWLINAANEETKKSVASYFNPIKLTDRTTNPKGVHEPKYGTPTQDENAPNDSTYTEPGARSPEKGGNPELSNDAVMQDPFAVITEVAGGFGLDASEEGGKEKGMAAPQKGGEAFYDPFDPRSWNTDLGLGGELIADADRAAAEKAAVEQAAREKAATSSAAGEMEKAKAGTMGQDAQQEAALQQQKTPAKAADRPKQSAQAPAASPMEIGLRQKLDEIAAKAREKGLEVKVEKEAEDYVLRLSDKGTGVMFDVGSVKPKASLVTIMDQLGATLNSVQGQVIIAGHTDGRQYKSTTFDNWQLSTSRAHMARYMLLHGGLEASRIERVEGYGDSVLLNKEDPYADENRRIEIRIRPS